MKTDFLKIAGVTSEKEFYKLYKSENEFFNAFPNARHMRKGGQLPKAQLGTGHISDAEAKRQNEEAYRKSSEQAKQEYINEYVKQGHSKIINNPVTQALAYATPAGMAIGAMQGAANIIPDLYDKNWFGAAGDAAMMLPVVGGPIAKGLKKVSNAGVNTPKSIPGKLNPEEYLALKNKLRGLSGSKPLTTEEGVTRYNDFRKLSDDLDNEYGMSSNKSSTPTDFKQELKALAISGKKPLLTKKQFYTRKELDEINKQRNAYKEGLTEYQKTNIDPDGGNFFDILSGRDPYMDKFHNLHPNLKNPGFGAKYTDQPHLMKFTQSDELKYAHIPDGSNKLLSSARDLAERNTNWFHNTSARDYVNEMRGSVGLNLNQVRNMSDEELKPIAQKIFDKLGKQHLQRYKQDIANPYTGKQAFQNISVNKFGGEPCIDCEQSYEQGGSPYNYDAYSTMDFGSIIKDIIKKQFGGENEEVIKPYTSIDGGVENRKNGLLAFIKPYVIKAETEKLQAEAQQMQTQGQQMPDMQSDMTARYGGLPKAQYGKQAADECTEEDKRTQGSVCNKIFNNIWNDPQNEMAFDQMRPNPFGTDEPMIDNRQSFGTNHTQVPMGQYNINTPAYNPMGDIPMNTTNNDYQISEMEPISDPNNKLDSLLFNIDRENKYADDAAKKAGYNTSFDNAVAIITANMNDETSKSGALTSAYNPFPGQSTMDLPSQINPYNPMGNTPMNTNQITSTNIPNNSWKRTEKEFLAIMDKNTYKPKVFPTNNINKEDSFPTSAYNPFPEQSSLNLPSNPNLQPWIPGPTSPPIYGPQNRPMYPTPDTQPIPPQTPFRPTPSGNPVPPQKPFYPTPTGEAPPKPQDRGTWEFGRTQIGEGPGTKMINRMNMASGFLDRVENRRQEKQNAWRFSGDAIGASMPSYRGDYEVNSGQFRPDDHTVIQKPSINYGNVGSNMYYAQYGQSVQDSVRHQADRDLRYEFGDPKNPDTGGGYDQETGKAFSMPDWGYHESQSIPADPNFEVPTSLSEATDTYMREVDPRTSPYFPDALTRGQANNFLFSTGRDVRPYIVDQLMKINSGQTTGLPNRTRYNVDTKLPASTPEIRAEIDSMWTANKHQWDALTYDQQQALMGLGRQSYGRAINRGKGMNNENLEAYDAVWHGRIPNLNSANYNEKIWWDQNNKPEQQYGGQHKGNEIYMTDSEIEQFMKSGGQLEFLD